MNKPVNVIVLGPQGSGKGTQAELLAKALGVPALSMGQLLRDEVASHSEMGKEIEAILKRGELVPEPTSREVLKRRLEQPDVKDGYVLDGFPRFLDQLMKFTFSTPTHVIVLEIPREESFRRIGSRLTCNKCGHICPPKGDGHVDGTAHECGGKIERRSDDTTDAVEKRLKIYEEQTMPVIRKFEETPGLVKRIDGIGTVQEVADRVRKAVA